MGRKTPKNGYFCDTFWPFVTLCDKNVTLFWGVKSPQMPILRCLRVFCDNVTKFFQ